MVAKLLQKSTKHVAMSGILLDQGQDQHSETEIVDNQCRNNQTRNFLLSCCCQAAERVTCWGGSLLLLLLTLSFIPAILVQMVGCLLALVKYSETELLRKCSVKQSGSLRRF